MDTEKTWHDRARQELAPTELHQLVLDALLGHPNEATALALKDIMAAIETIEVPPSRSAYEIIQELRAGDVGDVAVTIEQVRGRIAEIRRKHLALLRELDVAKATNKALEKAGQAADDMSMWHRLTYSLGIRYTFTQPHSALDAIVERLRIEITPEAKDFAKAKSKELAAFADVEKELRSPNDEQYLTDLARILLVDPTHVQVRTLILENAREIMARWNQLTEAVAELRRMYTVDGSIHAAGWVDCLRMIGENIQGMRDTINWYADQELQRNANVLSIYQGDGEGLHSIIDINLQSLEGRKIRVTFEAIPSKTVEQRDLGDEQPQHLS